MVGEKPNYQGSDLSAPFNMAIATLMRISDILRDITKIRSDPTLPSNIKQSIIINLVKELFSQSSPLLQEAVVDKYRPIVNKLNVRERDIIINKGGITRKTEKRIVYDPELDNLLENLTIDIQRELQREKLFMPPKTDPRYGWKQY